MSQVIQPPHQEVAAEARQVAAKDVAETGWKQAGQERWLWPAVTATAALLFHARRGVGGCGPCWGRSPCGCSPPAAGGPTGRCRWRGGRPAGPTRARA
jgi:hypothetical protein